MGLDYESDFYCVTLSARQSPLDGAQEAVLQPLFGVGALRPHDKKAVLVGDGKRPLEPGVVGGPGHLELQLTLGDLPDSMGVHALYDLSWTEKKGSMPSSGGRPSFTSDVSFPGLPRASLPWYLPGREQTDPEGLSFDTESLPRTQRSSGPKGRHPQDAERARLSLISFGGTNCTCGVLSWCPNLGSEGSSK